MVFVAVSHNGTSLQSMIRHKSGEALYRTLYIIGSGKATWMCNAKQKLDLARLPGSHKSGFTTYQPGDRSIEL